VRNEEKRKKGIRETEAFHSKKRKKKPNKQTNKKK